MAPSADLAGLLRWERAGGTWHLIGAGTGPLTISLCRCDSGEEVDRLVSNEADLRAYVTK